MRIVRAAQILRTERIHHRLGCSRGIFVLVGIPLSLRFLLSLVSYLNLLLPFLSRKLLELLRIGLGCCVLLLLEGKLICCCRCILRYCGIRGSIIG